MSEKSLLNRRSEAQFCSKAFRSRASFISMVIEKHTPCETAAEECEWDGPDSAPRTCRQDDFVHEFMNTNKCNFCQPKILVRLSGSKSRKECEEALFAHLIMKHLDDQDAMKVIEKRRWKIASCNLEDKLAFALPFRLDVNEKILLCSSCVLNAKSFSSLAKLRLHYESCSKNVEVEASSALCHTSTLNKDSRRRCIVKCPLADCPDTWYSNKIVVDEISIVVHLIFRHTTNKEAYAMAIQLSERYSMAERTPFLSVQKSFEKSVVSSGGHSVLMCSKCYEETTVVNDLMNHAKNAHTFLDQSLEFSHTPMESRKRDRSSRVIGPRYKQTLMEIPKNSSERNVDETLQKDEQSSLVSQAIESASLSKKCRSVTNWLRFFSSEKVKPIMATEVVHTAEVAPGTISSLAEVMRGKITPRSMNKLRPGTLLTDDLPCQQLKRMKGVGIPVDVSHIQNIGFPCSSNNCSFVGATALDVRIHYKQEHRIMSGVGQNRTRPIRNDYDTEAVCNQCQKVFCNYRELNVHAKERHPSKPCFVCRYCSMPMVVFATLRSHEKKEAERRVAVLENKKKCDFDVSQSEL